ncbi:ABC transporter substrate-binding protein [Methylocystis iwaonis]
MRLNSAAPFFVASDKGFFEDEGLKVQIEYFDAAAQLPVAAVANSIDVGMTAFTAAYFNLAAKGKANANHERHRTGGSAKRAEEPAT